MSSSLLKRLTAESIGTFVLVFGGTGTAVLAAGVLDGDKVVGGVGWVGVALAFGLTVVVGAYALGHISGGHFNPAVSLGLFVGKRFSAKDLLSYWVAQVAGAIAGSAVLYAIASGRDGFSARATGFASNGYGDHSPAGIAPLAIGLALTLIHLISIPVTNTSVNPARSIAPALFVGGWALGQLWMFIVFPLVGGALGGLIYHYVLAEDDATRS